MNRHLEHTLLMGHQIFNTTSMLNLEVHKFWDWLIFTQFIFDHSEPSSYNIWSEVNFERMCVLFYYFLEMLVNPDLQKKKQKQKKQKQKQKTQAIWIFTKLYFCIGESLLNCFWRTDELIVNPNLQKKKKKKTQAIWIFTELYFRIGESFLNCFWRRGELIMNLAPWILWKGEQCLLQEGKFKVTIDGCISVSSMNLAQLYYFTNSLWKTTSPHSN